MDEAKLAEIDERRARVLRDGTAAGALRMAADDVPDLVAAVRRLTAALDAVTTEHAAALDAARREGAEGMREVVKAEIHAAFHYNDPPDDGVERPIGPVPGQWEAHQTLRKLLSRVCAVLTDGGAS